MGAKEIPTTFYSIEKMQLPCAFNDNKFTYNGNERALSAARSVPLEGVEVRYSTGGPFNLNSPPKYRDVGEYNVTAGAFPVNEFTQLYYEENTAMGTLTILPATQKISFEDKIYDGSPQFFVDLATSNAIGGASICYSIDDGVTWFSADNPPTITDDDTMKVLASSTAINKNNYHATATAEAILTIKNAVLPIPSSPSIIPAPLIPTVPFRPLPNQTPTLSTINFEIIGIEDDGTFQYKEGGDNTIALKIIPSMSVIYLSSNTDLATVDKNGLISFKNAKGRVVITVIDANNFNNKKTVTINVLDDLSIKKDKKEKTNEKKESKNNKNKKTGSNKKANINFKKSNNKSNINNENLKLNTMSAIMPTVLTKSNIKSSKSQPVSNGKQHTQDKSKKNNMNKNILMGVAGLLLLFCLFLIILFFRRRKKKRAYIYPVSS